METNTVYSQNINFRVRRLGKQHLLIGNGEAHELNEIALIIWDSINGENDIKSVIDIIDEKYNASTNLITNDVIEFINYLKDINAIEE